ncbi:MAG: hypothetical protein Q7U57_14375 [Methylovulum sp.]|nr:hypothetical protein [Methylovulum sp.]
MPLLIQYIQLCWFTNNPIDLHPSSSFLWKCVLFYLVSGIIVEANISDPADATLEVAMRTIVALSLLSALVLATNKRPLFMQLLIAVFICENVMMTLGIGVEIYDVFVKGTPYEEYPTYLGVLLIFWYMAILSYIFRQVFSFKTASSVISALFYFLSTYGGPFLVMEVI